MLHFSYKTFLFFLYFFFWGSLWFYCIWLETDSSEDTEFDLFGLEFDLFAGLIFFHIFVSSSSDVFSLTSLFDRGAGLLDSREDSDIILDYIFLQEFGHYAYHEDRKLSYNNFWGLISNDEFFDVFYFILSLFGLVFVSFWMFYCHIWLDIPIDSLQIFMHSMILLIFLIAFVENVDFDIFGEFDLDFDEYDTPVYLLRKFHNVDKVAFNSRTNLYLSDEQPNPNNNIFSSHPYYFYDSFKNYEELFWPHLMFMFFDVLGPQQNSPSVFESVNSFEQLNQVLSSSSLAKLNFVDLSIDRVSNNFLLQKSFLNFKQKSKYFGRLHGLKKRFDKNVFFLSKQQMRRAYLHRFSFKDQLYSKFSLSKAINYKFFLFMYPHHSKKKPVVRRRLRHRKYYRRLFLRLPNLRSYRSRKSKRKYNYNWVPFRRFFSYERLSKWFIEHRPPLPEKKKPYFPPKKKPYVAVDLLTAFLNDPKAKPKSVWKLRSYSIDNLMKRQYMRLKFRQVRELRKKKKEEDTQMARGLFFERLIPKSRRQYKISYSRPLIMNLKLFKDSSFSSILKKKDNYKFDRTGDLFNFVRLQSQPKTTLSLFNFYTMSAVLKPFPKISPNFFKNEKLLDIYNAKKKKKKNDN